MARSWYEKKSRVQANEDKKYTAILELNFSAFLALF